MATLFMTKGLPGSGKSTWASAQAQESKGKTVRITKDMLRLMLNGTDAGRGLREKNVLRARDALVASFLATGTNVIVDDTNFNPTHETRLRNLAATHQASFVVQDFTDVDLAECIRRDLTRPNSVGADVIKRMWQQYLYIPGTPAASSELPLAVIVDLDGTVALMNGRNPYDHTTVDTDVPNRPIIWMVQAAHHRGAQVIYMSGRSELARDKTRAWLNNHVGVAGPLHMRAANDNRADNLVKRDLFDAHVRDKFNVVGVFDDRDQVVDLWRSMGLTCLQVGYGAF